MELNCVFTCVIILGNHSCISWHLTIEKSLYRQDMLKAASGVGFLCVCVCVCVCVRAGPLRVNSTGYVSCLCKRTCYWSCWDVQNNLRFLRVQFNVNILCVSVCLANSKRWTAAHYDHHSGEIHNKPFDLIDSQLSYNSIQEENVHILCLLLCSQRPETHFLLVILSVLEKSKDTLRNRLFWLVWTAMFPSNWYMYLNILYIFY